jgi:hypothetical protein
MIEINVEEIIEQPKEDSQKINKSENKSLNPADEPNNREEPTITEQHPYMTHLMKMEN